MPQEDKFKREIDRIGMIIGMLINKLLDKHNGPEETIRAVVQQMKEELDIDLEAFLAMGKGDDLDLLLSNKKFSVAHLRDFGNLLYELGQKTTDVQKKKKLLEKALNIYEHISTKSKGTLFLDVEYRIRELTSD